MSKTNEVGIFIAFDFNACEECNVDTSEAEGSARSSAYAGVDDLDGKRVRINTLTLAFRLLISSVPVQWRRRRPNVPGSCHFRVDVRSRSIECGDVCRKGFTAHPRRALRMTTNFGIQKTECKPVLVPMAQRKGTRKRGLGDAVSRKGHPRREDVIESEMRGLLLPQRVTSTSTSSDHL